MKVTIFDKHLRLSEEQKDTIEQKLKHLEHMGQRIQDESVTARIDVELNHEKTTDHNIDMAVTIHVPHGTLRAEVQAKTPEEAIDLAIDKLRKQLERYKETGKV